MTDLELVASLSGAQTVGLTLYGEARGEPVEGRIAVANVIRNRVKAQKARFGLTLKDVCLKAWQFSCWLPEGDKDNYDLVIAAARALASGEVPGPMLRECLWIADGLVAGAFMDNVRNATHYYSPAAMKPRHRIPDWAEGQEPIAIVAGHFFFAGVK